MLMKRARATLPRTGFRGTCTTSRQCILPNAPAKTAGVMRFEMHAGS
jgi:hypothetical protein